MITTFLQELTCVTSDFNTCGLATKAGKNNILKYKKKVYCKVMSLFRERSLLSVIIAILSINRGSYRSPGVMWVDTTLQLAWQATSGRAGST